MQKRSLNDRLSVRAAKSWKAFQSKPLLRALGPRGAITLLLGTALSVGGLTDAVSETHFLVAKDLDTVRVVRQRGEEEKVIAKLNDGFAANSVFKLSQALPESLVSRQIELFSDQWFPLDTPAAHHQVAEKRDVFREEMKRLNEKIREEFFANAIPYGDLIHEKAEKYGVDPALVAAVIEQESRFKPRAKSHVGARGLMQLMPRTGRWMGAKNLYDPEQNVDAGVKYIKYLDKRFKGNLKNTIAAYNAGEGNVQRYGGIPPFRETRTYVKKVLKNYDKRTRQLEAFEKKQLAAAAVEDDDTGIGK